MMARRTQLERSLIALAKQHGAVDVKVERTFRHHLLRGRVGSRPFVYFFASTASDRRAEHNACSGLCRVIRQQNKATS
jgi:hypothetical protein